MNKKHITGIIRLATGLGVLIASNAFGVKVSVEKLDYVETFKVETEMGTFHWESPDGKSGWMSAFDLNGKDWIQAGPKQRGVGNHSDYRGLPNSGANDWGHPSRKDGHNKAGTTNKIVGDKEGAEIIIESDASNIKVHWHCFETHIAMEIKELKKGKYHFLLEGTPGGKIHTERGIVTADGKTRPIKEGWFAETPDWPAGDVGEWFYILDPNEKYNFWMAQTPATTDKGELWYQKGNMDLASFGRPDNKPTFTDIERRFAFGFVPDSLEFEAAKKHIETILTKPLEGPVGINLKANGTLNQKPSLFIQNGVAHVSYSKEVGGFSAELFDISGQLMDTWKSNSQASSHILKALKSGVYFFKSTTGNGEIHHRKIIVK